MDLPPIHNMRSPQQWEIISKHIDFKGKTVLDLGFGYGDIFLRCRRAHAKTVYGIDKDQELFEQLGNVIDELGPMDDGILGDRSHITVLDLDVGMPWDLQYDIIICFSVLPYLKQPFTVLEWIREHSKVALIECQYKGDGPGFELITDDGLMFSYLERVGWQSIEPIGKTFVEDRGMYRTIWLCQ